MQFPVQRGGEISLEMKQTAVLSSLIVDFVLWLSDIAAVILSGSFVLFAAAV